jgi:hypothetical protein
MTMDPIRFFKKSVLRAEIVLGLAFARALVVHVPFRWWRGRIGPIGTGPWRDSANLAPRQQKQARDIGRMVARLARRMPFEAVCLPQAMTARWILQRRGIPAHIEFGSRPEKTAEGIGLHAWLVAGDVIVTGRKEHDSYASFAAISRKGSPPAG